MVAALITTQRDSLQVIDEDGKPLGRLWRASCWRHPRRASRGARDVMGASLLAACVGRLSGAFAIAEAVGSER
jgi:hypothetical protein